jgi:general secretion pathway protein A
MYETFFGLTERPFELTTNPRYLFLTARHREALGMLQYGFASRKGMLVMTGEAGTGKTTMLTVALGGLGSDTLVAYLNNPTLSRTEFVESMTEHFGLPADAAASKTRFLQAVTRLLEERAAEGQLTALVIDEAHSLPNELLEEVRLLANIERPDQKLLSVVLVGQPELADRLNDPSLRQLKQRVALRCQLVPLTLRETAAYVAKRIRLAGGDSVRVFTREAVETIYEYSAGIPRTINVICDNALVSAFAQDEQPVSRQTVLDVCSDFDLSSSAPAPADRHARPAAQPPPATTGPPARRQAATPAPRQAGSLLDLRPVAVMGAHDSYGSTPEEAPKPSFWSSLRFWRR